jgi:hypothetical protein
MSLNLKGPILPSTNFASDQREEQYIHRSSLKRLISKYVSWLDKGSNAYWITDWLSLVN